QRAASIKLNAATQDTRSIITTANRMLKELYRPGYNYQKCGVQLSHIQPETTPGQMDVFDSIVDGLSTENRGLMKAIDQINRRFPRAVSIAATGFDKSWKPKAERISQRYTTDWRELVCVKAG
ncbi:MAG: DUF4113 domain-containing protein, partial [Methylophilaceae bacterium]|nr:DUF4113 domain-containing protein [Methylophilaceae bacterium]